MAATMLGGLGESLKRINVFIFVMCLRGQLIEVASGWLIWPMAWKTRFAILKFERNSCPII